MKVLYFLLALFISLQAEVSLNNDVECYDHFSIEYFYDPSNALAIEDVQKQHFSTTTNNFTFGYLDGTTWFKVTLVNNSKNEDYLLKLNETLWKSFNLYEFKNDKWHVDHNGLDIPLEQRKFHSIYPTFKLNIPANTQKTFYIQGQTVASQLGELSICSKEHYFKSSHFELVDIYIIFAFSLLSILILNFYSYILTKEVVYLYYVFYTLVLIVFSSMQSGFYLLLGFDGWNQGLHVVGTFVLITLALFSDKFLELKERYTLIHKLFNISVVISFAFAILIFYDIPYSSLLFNLYSIIFFSVLFYATVQAYRKNYIGAKYYLIALTIYMLSMSLMILTFRAFLEYNVITRHLFLAGSFIELLFFTLILVNKYRTLNLEKIRIAQELIEEKDKNEDALKLAVERRTQELEYAKQELEKLVVTDHLTKIKNRRAYNERIDEQIALYKRHQIPFSMLIFDIDDFKKINDTYGHRMGDKVLNDLANLVTRNIRKHDYFFRIGGEEFVLLFGNTKLSEALQVSQNLLSLIKHRLKVNTNEHITVSMGLTEALKEDTEDSIYKRADSLLYKSKDNGKNQVSF